MRQQRWTLLTAVVAAVVALSAVAPALADHGQVHGINPADMDLRADPRVDFYRFANGGWLDRTTIPADEGSYGVFQELDDLTTRQLLDLLNDLAAAGALQEGSDEWKAVRLFAQGTDLATRNAQGIEPIRPLLAEVDAIADLGAFHAFQRRAGFSWLTGLFYPFVIPDLQNSAVYAAYLSGPFLGLPNRDYYLQDDAANQAVRDAYRATNAKLLGFAGEDAAAATAAAQAVYDLERAFAEKTLTREEEQDISLFYNPITLADLATKYPLMDWPAYTQELGLTGVDRLVVTQPRYFDALAAIVRATPLETLKDYVKLEIMWSFPEYLSEEIEATAFEFRGKVLEGAAEQRPLDERVLAAVNGIVGEAVGKLYVEEHFPPEAKAQIDELVEGIVAAFRARLDANTWMSDATTAKALAKLDAMRLKVGYPDRWRAYDAVEIGDSYAVSFISAQRAEFRRQLDRVGEPVDKDEWGIPPQTVNAFYNPTQNEMVFPAGILQPPFFDYRADPASNYGAIGFVIGHEITHGFDLQGSQFDAEGNLANWWTPEDQAAFDALNKRAAEQYAKIEVLPGLFVNGQITVTENVADLGGVQVAFDALRAELQTEGVAAQATPLASPFASPAASPEASPEASPGASPMASSAGLAFESLTPEQRFFVAAASVWRTKIRDEALTTQVKADVHAPGSVRGTQPLKNMDAFFAAFGIRAGDPMYLPPDQRLVVW